MSERRRKTNRGTNAHHKGPTRTVQQNNSNELDFDALDEFFDDDDDPVRVWEPVNPEELVVDPLDLPEEWIKQPVLYDRAIVAVKDAKRSMDASKEDLDVLIAETRIRLRTTKPKEKDVKITDKYVNEMIEIDEHVIRAKRLYNLLSQQHGLMVGRVRSVEMKKKTLENLVTLVIGQLYSLPKEGRTIKNVKNLEEIARKRSNQEHRQNLAISKLRRKQQSTNKPRRMDEDLTEEEILEAKGKISTNEVADEMEKRIRERRDRRDRAKQREQEPQTETANRRRRTKTR